MKVGAERVVTGVFALLIPLTLLIAAGPVVGVDELRGGQTAIGSFFGFVALMTGALWNFHLNRKRDEALRKDERVSVAAALYGEILLLRKAAAHLALVIANVYMRQGISRSAIKFDENFLEA